jgi:hypothetical protein
MSTRTFVETLLRGWLPRNPIETKTEISVYDGSSRLWNGRRMLRLGGVSGLLWSTLSLFIVSGVFYVVGITSPLYHAIDIGVTLTGIAFFIGMYLTFLSTNPTKAWMAMLLGIGSSLVRFSMYVTSQVILTVGLGYGVLQELAKMGIYSSLTLSSGLLIALSIIIFGTLISFKFFRILSVILGAFAAAGGLTGLALEFQVGSGQALRQVLELLQSIPQYVSMVWVLLTSASFLYFAKAIDWKTGALLVAVLLFADYLSLVGILWLPHLLH